MDLHDFMSIPYQVMNNLVECFMDMPFGPLVKNVELGMEVRGV